VNIDIGLASALHRTAFLHRATPTPDGQHVIYRLADGSGHVTIPRDEWEQIGEIFQKETKAIRRRAIVRILLLPFVVLLVGFTIAQVVPGGGLLIVTLFFGGPVANYLWQSHGVKKVSQAVEATFATLPRTHAAPPPTPERLPRWLDIACIFLVGPWLILALIGEFGGPDTYRNTPLKGMHLDGEAWVAIGVLALRLTWPHAVRTLRRFGRRTA
jgi:hypothetical protein